MEQKIIIVSIACESNFIRQRLFFFGLKLFIFKDDLLMFEHMFKYLLLTHTNDLFRTLMYNVRKKEAKSPIPRKPNFVFFCDDLISTLKKLSLFKKRTFFLSKLIFFNCNESAPFSSRSFLHCFSGDQKYMEECSSCSEYMFCYISCKGMQELCVCSSAILISRQL